MPDTTPVFGLPFPEDSDPVDVAGDIEGLALGVEADLIALDARLDTLEAKRAWTGKASGTDQTGIAGLADVTGVTATWTATSTRQYKVSLDAVIQKITTANAVTAYITNGANATVIARSVTLAINDLYALHIEWVETGLSGSQTRKGRMETASGSVSVINSFSRNAILTVEDIGPA